MGIPPRDRTLGQEEIGRERTGGEYSVSVSPEEYKCTKEIGTYLYTLTLTKVFMIHTQIRVS